MTLRRLLPLALIALSVLAGSLGLPGGASAEPFRTPTIDGTITVAPTDWAAADSVVADRPDDSLTARTGNFRNLWLTWDAQNLYVGMTYQAFNYGLSVYFDLGHLGHPAGVTSAAALDTLPNNFLMPAGRKIGLVIGQRFGGSLNAGVIPQVRLVTDEAGHTVNVSAQTTRAQSVGTLADKRIPFFYNCEIAIPWSVLYGSGATPVPAYATLRAVAIITGLTAESNGVDSAPDNPGLDGGTTPVTLQNFHVSVIDIDGDGQPDPADASVSGTVTLPGHESGLPLIASATLTGWAGGDLGVPLVVKRGSVNATTYTVPRLPAGGYHIAVGATGYLPGGADVTVSAGQAATGVDLTLQRATALAGTVGFESGPGAAGAVTLYDAGNAQVGRAPFTALGGPFTLYVVSSGRYRLEAVAPTYVATDTTLDVTAGTDVAGLALQLPRAAEVSGEVAFEGPGAAGTLRLYDGAGAPVAGGARAFTAEGGAFTSFYLAAGTYRVSLTAPGYVPRDSTFTVVGRTPYPLGTLRLSAVRATHLVATDESGAAISSVATTVSIPADGLFFYAPVRFEARDAADRLDLYDLDGRLAGYAPTARKLDDVSPPRGNVGFWSAADTTALTSLGFVQGVARFLISDDAVEILRLTLAGAAGAPVGRTIAGFGDPQPKTIVLTAARDTLVADGRDEISIVAQLYDSANNPSRLSDVPVGFAVSPSSTGRGAFRVPTVLTNADGRAVAVLAASGAGTLQVTAAATAGGIPLAVRAGSLTGPATLAITALPGPAKSWRLTVAAAATSLHDPIAVTAQLVDSLGNAAALAGAPISFTVTPGTLGAFEPATAVSDAQGRAVTQFRPAGVPGVATLGGTAAGRTVGETYLRVRDVTVVSDPPYDLEPAGHHTFPNTDLTALLIDNDAASLKLEIPFVSDWAGLQLHLLIETGFNADGGTADPFLMPVSYAHADKPDFVLTTKYSANDYGDFRKWSAGGWQFWDLDNQVFSALDTVNKNIQNLWTEKTPQGMRLTIPWAALRASPDVLPGSLRCEIYLTQEDGGQKRAALDSAPPDSTLNLNFALPGTTADWLTTTSPVTLHNWGAVYTVKTAFPPAPTVSEAAALPTDLRGGDAVTLRARVVGNAGGGVGDVLANLSAIGGPAIARMYDDGLAQHGDQSAGDGLYGLLTTVPLGSPGGSQPLVVNAWDATNTSAAADTATVVVTATVQAIVHAIDPVGDDHGPNLTGVQRKYYTYPTNSVFVPGCFDLTSLDVYETVAVVGGESVPVIAFRVGIADFPDPSVPGHANWNPLYANLDVEKIDIMINSGPGGATAGLPNRRADFEAWNGWNYAVIMDGWYKAVVPSLGQNTPESWRQNALKDDRSITILSDFNANWVTALVAKEALGNPTADDMRKWNICVAMTSHDSPSVSNEQDMGGTRWVNESRSEWNLGGGDASDRDPNLIDLLLVPGVGRAAGRPQEQLLDYESAEAQQRLAAGKTPSALEITTFEDTGPPVVRIAGGAADVVRQTPLLGAPINYTVDITDDNQVARAEFRYRPAGFAGTGWAVTQPMGFATGSLWSVDLLPTWLDANLTASPVDGTRYLEFQVVAWDPLDKQTTSPVITMQIDPAVSHLGLTARTVAGDLALRLNDGSTLRLDAAWQQALAGFTDGVPWTGPALAADTLSVHLELDAVAPEIAAAPAVPAGRALGVFRGLRLARVDAAGATLLGRLPGPVDVALHYPQEWVPAGVDENHIGLYEYVPRAGRWVLVGGNVNPLGNVVTARVNTIGTYGLFASDELGYDPGAVVSGILISPNPFSPNGDNLYDETTISFFLTKEATVSVEIYNIEGNRQRVITQAFPFAGDESSGRVPRRIPGLTWDGRDQAGDPVPYGIYILRLGVTYNQAGGTRTIRSSHPVAVIR